MNGVTVQSAMVKGARGTSSRYAASMHAGASPVTLTTMEFAQYVTVVRPSVYSLNDCVSNSVGPYTLRHSMLLPLVGWNALKKVNVSHPAASAGRFSHPTKARHNSASLVCMPNRYRASLQNVKSAKGKQA